MNTSVLNVGEHLNLFSRIYPLLKTRNVLPVAVSVLTDFYPCRIFKRNFPLDQVPLVAAEKSAVTNHRAQQKAIAVKVKKGGYISNMKQIEFSPSYSTSEISGKCVKCLAEEELNNCLFQLLSSGGEDEDLQKKFNALVDFLRSPEARTLVDESERYLSEGKKVSVKIHFEDEKVRYEIVTE